MNKLDFESFVSKLESNVEREYRDELVDRKLSYINNTANYVINGEWTVDFEEFPISMENSDIAGFLNGEEKISIVIGAYDNGASTKKLELIDLANIIKDIKNEEHKYTKKSIENSFDDEEIEYEFYSAMIDQKKTKELIIYTNRLISDSLMILLKDILDDHNYAVKIYDIKHIYDCYLNYAEIDEDFVVNISEFNNNIKALKVQSYNGVQNVQVYLFAIDASTLGSLYRRHETRLLIDNVRLYLKTSKINGGIIKSLEEEPENFVSYNNGISGVATDIEFDENDCIESITEFQIVNGGQTTASIYDAIMRNKISNPKQVFIPVKLTVISKEQKDKNLQIKIAKYANSQNKVNESDFASTQDFFILFKEFCKVNEYDSLNENKKIFFNIMRGQKEIYMHREGMKPKDFKIEFPLILEPTDISRIEMLWQGKVVEAAKGKEGLLSNFIKNYLEIEKPKYLGSKQEFKEIIGKIIIKNYLDILSKDTYNAYSMADPNRKITNNTKPFGTIHSRVMLYATAIVFESLRDYTNYIANLNDNIDYLKFLDKAELILLMDDTFQYLTSTYRDVNEATKKPATFKTYLTKFQKRHQIIDNSVIEKDTREYLSSKINVVARTRNGNITNKKVNGKRTIEELVARSCPCCGSKVVQGTYKGELKDYVQCTACDWKRNLTYYGECPECGVDVLKKIINSKHVKRCESYPKCSYVE